MVFGISESVQPNPRSTHGLLWSVGFCQAEIPFLTARRSAWPDGCVDSEWTELHETPDAMPSRIGVENQLPEDLHHAMGVFIEKHPQWDEYRLLPEPAGMAGFLFQQGRKDPCHGRSVTT